MSTGCLELEEDKTCTTSKAVALPDRDLQQSKSRVKGHAHFRKISKIRRQQNKQHT